MEALGEQNNVLSLEKPELPFHEKIENKPVHNSPARLVEGVVEPIVYVVRRRYDTIASVLKVLKITITAYLMLIALPNVIFESFPQVPCRLPIISRYPLHCTRELGHPKRPVINPDFITLTRLQGRLENVMDDSARSSMVSVDIKESEMALRDLNTLVKHSSLDNKVALGRDLTHFVEDARTASGSLQRFGSRVWGSVDRIVSGNEHTLVMLEELLSETSGRRFSWGERETIETRREKIGDLWLRSVKLLEKTLRELIHQARDNVGLLERLEGRLHNIQDMTVAEEEKLRVEERGFKKLWFSDEEKLQSHSASRKLLQMVQDNRKHALNHVSGVLFKLEQMSNDLDDLREGVATPIIVASSSNLPIEAHIRHIRSVTERLINGQAHMREIEDEYRRKKYSD